MKFYVTFGQQYAREVHPVWKKANPNGWLEIEAKSFEEAKKELTDVFGNMWSFIYPEGAFRTSYYPAGCLGTLKGGKIKNANMTYMGEHQCPICETVLSAVSNSKREKAEPTPGDLSICFKCASLLRFAPDMELRPLLTSEFDKLDINLRLHLTNGKLAICEIQRNKLIEEIKLQQIKDN